MVSAVVKQAINSTIDRAHEVSAVTNDQLFNTNGQGLLNGPYSPAFGRGHLLLMSNCHLVNKDNASMVHAGFVRPIRAQTGSRFINRQTCYHLRFLLFVSVP